jgi:hypothetical protein
MTDTNQIDLEIEETIGLLYSKFYQLRQLKEYQLEYDIMGTLMQMLCEDRQFLRENYRSQLGEWNDL